VLFVAGDQVVQPLGNRHVRLVQRHVETRVGEAIQLLASRLDHGRRAVARVEHGQPGAQVDQAVAVDVRDDPAEGGADEDGYGAEDPAGDGLQAPFEQLLRSGPGNLSDEAPFLLDVHPPPPVASWGEDEPKRLAFPSLHAAREGVMATTVKRREMFIGGEWTPGASGQTQPVVNPATGEVIVDVPAATEEDVDRAVRAAGKAFDEVWFDTTPGERSTMLLKLADAIEANADEIGRLESENVGKPFASVMRDEMPVMVDNLRFFAGGGRILSGAAVGEYFKADGTLYTSMLRRELLGVVGLIAPWVYPLWMAIWKFGPAPAEGNTVVVKPSEWTPLSILRVAELAGEIFPPGVFNVVTGDGVQAGEALVKHPDVAMVSLTGGVTIGQAVASGSTPTSH
jgi:delta 1-pyrroline-5-carboxylate dehydrogenase